MIGTVEITGSGRSGYVVYREGGHELRCDREFCGGHVVASICVPPANGWDTTYPWAAGRRGEILGFIALETRRQKAYTTEIQWDTSGRMFSPIEPGHGFRRM
jgi:hypothetical protein